MRSAKINRKTAETTIHLNVELDGTGTADIKTGIPFLDHMLTLFAKHSGISLSLEALGDIDVDLHHTVEDIGICLGKTISEALGDKNGITRYGAFYLPMDETLCRTVIDLSNRAYLKYTVSYPMPKTGNFDVELVQEFFQAVASNAGMTLHIEVLYGNNVHHIIESIFKSFARAFAIAIKIDPDMKGIPSTKGLL